MASFSIDYNVVAQSLPVQIIVTNRNNSMAKSYTAIFDTGATNTVLSKKIFNDLMLEKAGDVTLNGVNGTSVVNIAIADIDLPNNIHFNDTDVTICELPAGVDALLGMDITTRGNFHVDTAASTTTILRFNC